MTYLTINLEQVVVSSIKTTAGGNMGGEDKAIGELPIEEIRFTFSRIQTTYTQQSRSDGQGGGN